MKLLLFSALVLILFGCTNSGEKKTDTVVTLKDTQPPEIPGIPPAKVIGIFKGELPCKDCGGIQMILTLKDSSFSQIRNFKNAKDKKHSMSAELGNSIQSNGLISLLSKNKLVGSYRIISRDSILVLDSSGNSKSRQAYYLVRNKKF